MPRSRRRQATGGDATDTHEGERASLRSSERPGQDSPSPLSSRSVAKPKVGGVDGAILSRSMAMVVAKKGRQSIVEICT